MAIQQEEVTVAERILFRKEPRRVFLGEEQALRVEVVKSHIRYLAGEAGHFEPARMSSEVLEAFGAMTPVETLV